MNATIKEAYVTKNYYAFAFDPIHVGTGAYRLAGVDNTIMRDPATRLPKIPGSSLSGVTRANASMRLQQPAFQCAGKGGEGGEEHCGKPECVICISFGFSKSDKQSLSGMAQFFDASILLFPVYTMFGTVWMTSNRILKDKGLELPFELGIEQLAIVENFMAKNPPPDKLNISWLLLDVHPQKINAEQLAMTLFGSERNKEQVQKRLNPILNRLVIVHDNLFSRLVNDNLEVRTSVSIDPMTGAAVEGALFTYEAIPRTTFFEYQVVYNDPENFEIDGKKPKKNLHDVINAVETGMKDFAGTGVGGMNTRGFGRLSVLNLNGGVQ